MASPTHPLDLPCHPPLFAPPPPHPPPPPLPPPPPPAPPPQLPARPPPPRVHARGQHARRAPSAACTSPSARARRTVVSRQRAGSMKGEMWCGTLINDHATPRLVDDHDTEETPYFERESSTSPSHAPTSPRTLGFAPSEPYTITCERTSIAEAGLALFLFFRLPMPVIRGISCKRVLHFAQGGPPRSRSNPHAVGAIVGPPSTRAGCEGRRVQQRTHGGPAAASPIDRLQRFTRAPSGSRQQENCRSTFFDCWS